MVRNEYNFKQVIISFACTYILSLFALFRGMKIMTHHQFRIHDATFLFSQAGRDLTHL